MNEPELIKLRRRARRRRFARPARRRLDRFHHGLLLGLAFNLIALAVLAYQSQMLSLILGPCVLVGYPEGLVPVLLLSGFFSVTRRLDALWGVVVALLLTALAGVLWIPVLSSLLPL